MVIVWLRSYANYHEVGLDAYSRAGSKDKPTKGGCMEKWTKEQLQDHIKLNMGDYSSAVVIAMLYKKLYGEFPKIGLSGAQAEFADSVISKLPKRQVNDPDEC